MRVKMTSIISAIMFFVTLALCGFLYLGIPYNRVQLIYIAAGTIILCHVACKEYVTKIRRDRFVRGYILAVIFVVMIEMIYTRYTYGQSLSKTLGVAYPYFMVLFTIPFLCLMIHRNSGEFIFKTLNVFALIWYLVALAQSVLYPRIIIPAYFSFTDNIASQFRDGTLRIDLQLYGNFMIVYNFQKFYAKDKIVGKNRLFHIIMFALGMYELIFIQQTRMYTLTILACILLIVLFDKSNKTNDFLRKILVLALGIGVLMQTSLVSNILQSVFLSNSTLSASTNARLYSMNYYSEYFLRHPVFGMGFPNGTDFRSIVHGPLGVASFDDVGVVGQLAKLGVFVIIVYGLFILRCFYILTQIKKKQGQDTFILYMAIFAYLVLTSVSLIFLDPQRCLLYPVIFSLFEFQFIQMNQSGNAAIS